MRRDTRVLLERYCDLQPEELAALENPEQANPRTLVRLRRDGLLDEVNEPTLDGIYLLTVADVLQAHGPLPPVVEGDTATPHWTRLRRIDPSLTAYHVDVLRRLAREPGLAWGFLTHLFGKKMLRFLRDGLWLIHGKEKRGAPWTLTERGLDLVLSWIC